MTTKKIAQTYPIFAIEDKQLAYLLGALRDLLTEVINFNAMEYVSQNAKPTPDAGRMMIWKDADATAGQPTHYLVYNDGGTVVTFASVETA